MTSTDIGPGMQVKLKNANRVYTVISVDNHPYIAGGETKDEYWAKLKPSSGNYIAHWRVIQLEPVK